MGPSRPTQIVENPFRGVFAHLIGGRRDCGHRLPVGGRDGSDIANGEHVIESRYRQIGLDDHPSSSIQRNTELFRER